MATDFTQDTLLHFLQSRGGSVKNSDLLLHFRSFIRDHNDQNRNRELFKKFVNSVATVKQIDGVSFVVLRKKFKGHVPGGGEWGSAEPPRLHAGKNTEPSPRNTTPSPAGSAEKPGQKPQPREATTPAPLGVTARKTVLPVAGIVVNNNNNNVEAILNLKQQQGVGTRDLSGGAAAAAQVVSPTPEITAVKTPSVSEPHPPTAGQHRSGSRPPPGITSAVKPHGETSQQVPGPGTLRGREGLHQEPPLHHHTSLQQNVAPRRIRHRPSYKSAVSYDEDGDEEEEEEVQLRRGSAGGAWPQSTPLRDMGRAISASSPCIIDTPAHPSVVSSSSSSERQIPKIFVQNVNVMGPAGPGWSSVSGEGHRGQWSGSGLEPGSAPGESSSVRRSLPLEAEHYMASHGVEPHHNVHADPPYSQPLGVHLEPSQSQATTLSSSHSSIFYPSSDAGFSSSDWPPSGSPRGSGWNSSCENLKPRAGGKSGGSQIQEVLQRAQGKTSESVHPASSKTTAPWHHSTGHLHDDQHSSARVVPWHLSTGDLYDDREDAESSEGSTSSPPLRPRPAVARRLSSHLRSRMCRSLGANLDQLLQEEESGAGGGSEATRLNRLHMISSSLSLRYNLSSSSLSSCSTPPHYQSLNDLDERGRRSSPIAACPPAQPQASHKQSLVPLEPREHSWLVKGAAGAWPDIYTLFREDSSLLNRRDFISGFTVLHWIAKHGDHRVLNTLWYGVQKAGLTFDMNAKSTCGHTPLHIAAIHGNKNIMRLLVNKFNADVKLRDTAGKKAWQYLSCTTPPEVFQLLGAPTRPPEGPGGRDDPAVEQQQRRRRRRHHLSFASSGERPKTMTGTTRVKRSSSIAAFLKHKSLHMFPRQGESSI